MLPRFSLRADSHANHNAKHSDHMAGVQLLNREICNGASSDEFPSTLALPL